MIERFKQLSEVLVLRSLPGLLNLAALLLLATWMSTGAYGLVSTAIATSAALANLLFGSVILSALAQHAEHAPRGQSRVFESHLVSCSLLFGLAAGGVAAAASLAGLTWWPLLLGTGAFAAYTAIQEILHARVQFIRFAVASTSQSLLFLALVYSLVRRSPDVSTAMLAYAVSYGVGALVSAVLARATPGPISPAMLRAGFKLGAPLTLSTLASDSFALGSRYLLIGFGAFTALGIFSFSVDLAQRLIGIFINAATFAIVPRAFRDSAGQAVAALRHTLQRGALMAASVSCASLALLLAVATWGGVAALDKPLFDRLSLALVALGVIANRTGKLVLTPVAMRLRRTDLVLKSFAACAAAALALSAGGIALGLPYAAESGFLFAFAAWLIVGHLMLDRATRETSPNSHR